MSECSIEVVTLKSSKYVGLHHSCAPSAPELDAFSDPRHESGYSAFDIISLGILSSPQHAALLTNTPKLESVDLNQYDAVIVAGGQAPMYTFRDNKVLQDNIRNFYEADKPTAALCHGVAAVWLAL